MKQLVQKKMRIQVENIRLENLETMQPNYPWFRIFSVPGEKIFPALVQKDFCPWFGNFSNPVHADLRDQKKKEHL